MKKLLILVVVGLITTTAFAQKKRPLQYSKRFDSYYRKGPWKFAIEPGPTFLWGDLKSKRTSFNMGLSANTKVNAGLDLVFGGRYALLGANENGTTTRAALYQVRGMSRLFLRYDRIRTNIDRRKPPKFWHLYLTSGLNLSYHNATASSGGSVKGYKVNIPVGFGVPLKVGHRVKLVPEVLFYYNLNDKTDVLATTAPNDRFLIASLGIEFSPFTPRKKIKKIKVDEVEEGGSEGGDGSAAPSDNNSDSESDSFDSTPDDSSTEPTEESAPDPAPTDSGSEDDLNIEDDSDDTENTESEETEETEEEDTTDDEDDWDDGGK